MKKSKTKSDKQDKEKQEKQPESEQGGSIYRDTDWKDDSDRFQGSRGDTW
jgi:hypothetical protein